MVSKYLSRLQGERVLILGGTSGIGYTVAEATIEYGAIVIISGSNQSRVDTKVGELGQTHPGAKDRIHGKACDLSNQEDQESNIVTLLDFATENKTKKLDHIIVTAGDDPQNPPFSELTTGNINKALTVRMFAPLMLAKHAGTYLEESPRSSLTFTSGASTYRPACGWTLLPMIGGALDGLIRSLAVNIAPIRVNGVAPGPVLTERWGGGQRVSDEKAKTISENVKGRLLTGQIGAAEDVAEAYLHLMKNHNVTATMNLTDGGSLLK